MKKSNNKQWSTQGEGICWSPNTDFDGVDYQPLFDDIFIQKVPYNRLVMISQQTKLDYNLQKNSELTQQIMKIII